MATGTTETNQAANPKHTNRLITEKSPYLLQHAHNPVDWYPWCQEAIDKAKEENKLIFLSVGYSTCHWCHVMEKESFENEDVAKVMNEHFINIKVDREERPDLDRVYMLFIMATQGGGGWPMSVFLTPDLRPVTGGTYFPPEDRWGRPGFKTILLSLAKKWKDNQAQFLEASSNIMDALENISKVDVETTSIPGEATWNKCVRRYMASFEPQFGGFGTAPKFPQASILNFLFHFYARDKNDAEGKKCLEMCLHTLTKIAKGGIHDHVSSGFARYSVDNDWHVPHFEKMLYDQAQLMVAYTDAYLATKNEFFAEVVRDIVKYVNRDLRHELGGYYSAEDADSYPTFDALQKREGAFCVWEYNELESLLGHKTIGALSYLEIFCDYFSVEENGNISPDSDPHEELTNKNVLIIYGSKEETMSKFGLTQDQFNEVISDCINILYEERLKRPRPHLDTKILCSWNGLILAGLSQAGQGLGEKNFVEDAIKTAQFIKEYLFDPNTNTLLHSCYKSDDGNIVQTNQPIQGFLDDYAFLIKGLLDLYEASLDLNWLNWARELQMKQNELFWDDQNGGYFTCSTEDNTVVLRLKEDQDGAEPSGNSVSCHNLLRLAAYADKSAMSEGGELEKEMAKKILMAFSKRLNDTPTALPEMMSALMFYNDSPTQVLIAGGCSDPRTLELVRVVRSRLLPGRVLAVSDPAADAPAGMSDILLARVRSAGDVPTAYVCRRYACSLPVTDSKQLGDLLDE
ncbi:spermatogenesis-associated protein 20 isoform X3 [Vanessa tameamea]